MTKINAILRTKRIKDTDSVGKVFSHNLRTKYQINVDKTKTYLNEILLDDLGFTKNKEYSKILDEYYNKKGAEQKNNSVQMMEFVLSASPDFFKDISKKKLEEWKKTQIDFAKKKFGDNLKFAVLHLDEKTPHIHLCVTVEETKKLKYKNRYGVCEKEKTTLNAKRFNRQFLRVLQTEYAEANSKFGLQRGVYNSKATHQTLKDFHKKIEEISKKDYYDVVSDKIQKIIDKNKIFGTRFVDSKNIIQEVTPIMAEVFKSSKYLKTVLNFNSVKNVRELNNVLKKKQEIEDLRDDYKKAIKRDNDLMEENKKLLQEIELLKTKIDEYENDNAQKNEETKRLDKSRRLR